MSGITLEQFTAKYNGKSLDFDKHYGAQCTDLFNYYNAEFVEAPWIGTPATGGARDLAEVDSAARRGYYDVLPPSTPLIAGDVLVYGDPYGRVVENGKQKFYGHVAIYVGDGNAIQQNARKAQQTTIDPYYKSGIISVLRPKKFAIKSESQNVPQQQNNKNKHTIKSGDTFWDLEEVYNIPHGTLQQLNPQLDPKRLAIGSQIIIRAEPAPTASAPETYYTIIRGDTFWGLEDAWSLPHGTLQQLNAGQDPRTLQIGQRIRRS